MLFLIFTAAACAQPVKVETRVGAVREQIYRMARPLDALCALSQHKTLNARILFDGPQSEASALGNERLLWQGVYFVRFTGSSPKALDQALYARSAALPRPSNADTDVARLSALPSEDMIPGSRRYVTRFGDAAILAEYGCGNDGMSLARLASTDALTTVRSGALYPLGDEAYVVDNKLIVMRVGSALAAIETSNGLAPECLATVQTLEGMMRAEQARGSIR